MMIFIAVLIYVLLYVKQQPHGIEYQNMISNLEERLTNKGFDYRLRHYLSSHWTALTEVYKSHSTCASTLSVKCFDSVEIISGTYCADLDSLITGSSFRTTLSDAFSLPTNLFSSNTSVICSDVNNTNTKADHCKEVSLASANVPDFRYCCISSTIEWSPSSFRQWNRLMDFFGERQLLIFFLMCSTVSSLLSELLIVCVISPCRRPRLDSTDRPRRNRKKRSRCPFLLCSAISTALWCSSDNEIFDTVLFLLMSSNTFLLWIVQERCTYRAARCSWMLRWTKQKTFPWYKPNSSLKIWVHNPEYTDASVTSMPHSLRSSS